VKQNNSNDDKLETLDIKVSSYFFMLKFIEWYIPIENGHSEKAYKLL